MMLFFLCIIEGGNLDVAMSLFSSCKSIFVLAQHSLEEARLNRAIGLVSLGMNSLQV